MTPTGFFRRNALFLLLMEIFLTIAILQIDPIRQEMEVMISEPIGVMMGVSSDVMTLVYVAQARTRLASLKRHTSNTTGRELLDDPEIKNKLLEVRHLISRALQASYSEDRLPFGSSCVSELDGMESYAIMALDFLDDGPQILVVKRHDLIWQPLPESEIAPEFMDHLHDISEWTDFFMACKTRRFSTPPWTSP